MATTLQDIRHRAEEQVLTGVRNGQQAVIDTVTAWAKPIERLVPEGPSLSLPNGVPTTQELVDDTFAFTLNLIEAQRSFAADLLNAVSPILRKATGHAPKVTVAKAA